MSALINQLCEKWYEWVKLQLEYRATTNVEHKKGIALKCEQINEEASQLVDKMNEVFI